MGLMTKLSLTVLLLALFVAVGIFAPLAFIWALNTLFSLEIIYSFKTWLASFIIMAVASNGFLKVNYKRKN